jgi:spermidine synthase
MWFNEAYTDNCTFSIKTEKCLHSEQSTFQKIDFYESKDFGTFFTLDGYMMVNQKDEFIYHDMIVHVPMAVNPDIKKVLVIGGGDGGTIRELSRYQSIEHIDLVEIDERVVRLCQEYLPQTASQLTDERVTMYFEDGLIFIEDKVNCYDLILVDSTDPIGPGEGLFTLAFYENCYQALSEKGIMINQHESPYYPGDVYEMQKAHKKLATTFDVCKVYQFHMPTYASGHWLFGFASKGLDPIKDHKPEQWSKNNLYTKYYNNAIHKAAFALPTYVIELLEEAKK